ncbi:MAG: T9SS type A sorting domain-containing protein [Chitinophagaceae bacterium]|nr:T9SS type A sorting domain-containing protein [Chitinophagaceae bacterium]
MQANPVNGFNYYRIKQIDNNGSFKYSVVVTILKKDNLLQTIVAPNPVKDVLNIVEPKSIFITTAEIYSTTGQLMLRKIINIESQVYSLQVQQLPSATYILKVNYKAETKSYPFIKN